MGGEGGGAGQVGPIFTSSRDWTDAGLAYQLESCQCQGPGEPISQSACLALAENLPFSDRQNKCLDKVIEEEEYGMTLENRFACFVDIDLAAVDCLVAVDECSESAITDCRDARDTARTPPLAGCPTPHADIREMINDCQTTDAVDGVDAFLDFRSAQCDCLPNCTSADPDPEVEECMEDALQAEVDVHGPNELVCITKFWRQRAVCFGNEVSCDGVETACADIPAPDPACAISGTILLDILSDGCPPL